MLALKTPTGAKLEKNVAEVIKRQVTPQPNVSIDKVARLLEDLLVLTEDLLVLTSPNGLELHSH